jgi:type VI secretion system protein ImpK
MNIPGVRESFLLAQFRKFYAEIARLKGQIQTPAAAPAPEPGQASRETPLEPSPEAIQQALLSAIERQALEAERSGGAFAYEVYREAQYVFAALADEVFLNLDWAGSKTWPLLESQLFQSHQAGELFFEKLDLLLTKRDRAYQDLAAVFFMALALGFKGKYRGADESRLDRYRQELFLMIFQQRPHLLEEDVSLFPQSYLHTLREGSRKRLPDPRNWVALIPAVLLLWLLLSTLLWNHATKNIDLTLRRIEAAPSYLSTEAR